MSFYAISNKFQLNSPHNRSTNEAILHTQHMRIFLRIGDCDICQFDVEILIHTVQCARDAVIKAIYNVNKKSAI